MRVAHPHDSLRLFDDTPPDVEARMVELWRRASPQQRLAKALGLGRALNELTRSQLRQRYPDATAREIELRLASRNLDRETMIRAFGWDPDAHGR